MLLAKRKKIDPEALRKLRSLGYISNPNPTSKNNYGPEDDVKTLLPYYHQSNLAIKLYENKEISLNAAMETLKEVLSGTEKIDVAYKGLAFLYREQGRLRDAVEVLKTGIDNHPSSYDILLSLVEYLTEARQYQEVITLSNDSQVVQMEFEPDIWNFLGFAYLRTGNLEKAKITYEKALLIDDEDSTVLGNFGNVHLSIFQKTNNLNSHKKAIELFEKAVKLDPNNASAFDGLGIAYLMARDLDKSIYNWEKVLVLFPSKKTTVYNLARSYLSKGNKQEALILLTK